MEEIITVEPRWLLMVPGIYWEIGYRSRKRFERVYRKIEQFLERQTETPFPPQIRHALSRDRVEKLRSRLRETEGAEWLPQLLDVLETSRDTELDRMRAFAFADAWGADRTRVLKLFLRAGAAGLLDVSWEVICPSCRGAKVRVGKLRDLRKEAHCDACNIRYSADFAESVEVTFRPNPGIRNIDVADYCSGGPMNAPHVVVQQQLQAGETRTITLQLKPWRYRLRSLKLSGDAHLRVGVEPSARSVTMTLDPSTITPHEASVGSKFSLTILGLQEIVWAILRVNSAEDHTSIGFQAF